MWFAGWPSARRRSWPPPRRLPPMAAWARCRSRAVAERAGIAAGTVYRYFPSKTDLVAELVAAIAGRELEPWIRRRRRARVRCRRLAAGHRHLRRPRANERRLAWAVIAEPVDARCRRHAARFPPVARRRSWRRASGPRSPAAICRSRMRAVAAPAIVGALMEGLIGPLAPEPSGDAGRARGGAGGDIAWRCARSAWSMRARRGLVAQCVLPAGVSFSAGVTSSCRPRRTA